MPGVRPLDPASRILRFTATATLDYYAAMLNYRLAAMLVLLTCIISPLTFHWVTAPGGSWVRPYIVWFLVVIATWLWQRHRDHYEP